MSARAVEKTQPVVNSAVERSTRAGGLLTLTI